MRATHRRIRIVLAPDEAPVVQIVEQISRFVALGAYAPGDTLPSLDALAKELGISPVTVQRAYTILEKRGVTKAIPGSGTYIAENADTRGDLLRQFVSLVMTFARNLELSPDEVTAVFSGELARHYAKYDEASNTEEIISSSGKRKRNRV